MTGKVKEPGGDPAATETPLPGQQEQGEADRGLSGADIGDDPGEEPGDNELGGG